MSESSELQVVGQQQAVVRQQPSVGDMLQAVIEKGITAENVSAMEQLVGLYERMQSRDAERAFAEAFVKLQADMPKVQAIRPVPGNDGSVRYKFAPYEEIMRQVGPMLQRHGFTVTFSTDYDEKRLIKTCTLQHVGGHSKVNKFAVRIGQGPPKASESQSDGAASTYAKRFALCDALNIQIDHDTDADPRAEGGVISPGQASDLRRRVRECGADERAFLAFAGAQDFEDIVDAKYTMLDAFLTKKERLSQKKTP